ncbi:MAG: Natural resistance-associated macrophage protein [Schlesneria sp.]|nr:Natural resistance-associated macrophage protein [Schlesneria sp.]
MSDDVIAFDPYALPPDEIQEPPTTLWATLRKIGPGIILAGTIVGSGELILTTSLGAKHGFVFLWLILFSCVIKVFVQIEIGRYAISSGRPTLGAINELPGPRFGAHWMVWWWFFMMVCSVVQLGGMAGTVGQALNLAFPSVSSSSSSSVAGLFPWLGTMITARPEVPWAVATCLVAMALIYGGGYRRIEWLTTAIVVGVTLITVSAAVALNWTNYPVRFSDLLKGLEFQIPTDPDGLAAAFAVFGVTGVGATELFYYPYWCLEKGYARYVGRADGSEAWERRARGWIRVMHLDAWVSMVVFTISTVAFYLMGAAVLHPQGLEPKGQALIDTLSKMYVGPFGEWTRVLFLIGAGAVLFKTLYLSCAGNSRLMTDFLVLAGATKSPSAEQRARMIARLCLVFPLVALTFFMIGKDPKLMVTIGGVGQAATLPMIAGATLYFRYAKIHPALKPWRITDFLLWVAVISISVVAVYAVRSKVIEAWPKPVAVPSAAP